ncbi:hypothetical protein BT67DRAFT_424646 [Trichocladium antarcticum]|uniref:Ubiquitin-like protease family profile domain-containing protein n=1 Tax=Trichocladium antarcticum TaxID=1450529 RepID=A0AAN6ZCR8_9PEZI|nr:hypothetical protein BT67DRAFT_424646 [Trichocladium antarcticum]
MPLQASTPRTTRNSRGLRQSPGVDSTRVSTRRRKSGTPTPAAAAVARAFAHSTAADPVTPTPSTRFRQPNLQPPQTPALEAIQEEQPQLGTPTPAGPPTVPRPPIFPPPVTFPATATPYIFTTPQRASSSLQHPRVSSIKNTPTRSARRTFSPRTPVRWPTVYVTRFVDVTPTKYPSPAPESPGYETRRFRERRDEEGEEKFARELWIAIRNDHYMRDCWCAPPNIYNSRDEAEAAVGHLRFYVVRSGTSKNLRVLQKKNDFAWHCGCGTAYHPLYAELINANGKRPAEDSEVDLIAQNQGTESGQIISRVLPVVNAPTEDEGRQSQVPETTHSMWAQACGIFSRAVSTMGSPLVTLFGKLREQIHGDAYETLDSRWKDARSDTIIVKRLKRQAFVSEPEDLLTDDNDDGFEELVWAENPRKRIGCEQIQNLANIFATQLKTIKAGKVIGGSSIADIHLHIQNGQDLGTSIALHKYHEQEFGPVADEEPEHVRAEKMLHVLSAYKKGLDLGIQFMNVAYNDALFDDLKQTFEKPPRRLELGSIEFRQCSKMVGEFLCFLRSLDSLCTIDPATLEAICKMIVDANAIHKQQLLPSFVEVQANPLEDMPGFFPEDKVSAMEEVPADELTIQPLYDFKYPSPEPEEARGKPGDYKLIPKPKGILKPSKEWAEPPTPPRYVPTPEKKRKLAFNNPMSKFIPPANIPAQIMTPQEADQLVRAKLKAEVVGDEHSIRMFEAKQKVSRQRGPLFDYEKYADQWSLESLERDDKEMGLAYHARKYDGFLNDIQDDLEKRAEEEKENRMKPKPGLTPRKRMVRIPLPGMPPISERRRRMALEDGSPGTPVAERLSRFNPLSDPKVEEPPKAAKKKQAPLTVEEFFAQDDDDLEISVAKFEQLQIDRQIRDELQAGLKREVEEKKRREEEEALLAEERRLMAIIRRKEEERRRKEEEHRREQEVRRKKEAEEFAALTGLRSPIRPLITPLSGDWDLKVTHAARANPAVELVKTLEGQPLTRRDFEEKLLPPTAWLNDNVIIGSILHIASYINSAKGATDQEPKCAAFTSYFWPRLLSHGPSGCGRLLRRAGVRKNNFLGIDTILIPICSQSHWTLAVIRPGRRTVAHIDSMRAGSGTGHVKDKLLELVRFILEDQFVDSEWGAVDYEAPLQTNGWDCGVFTITNAMCLALELNPKNAYTERQLTAQRRRVAAMLLNEGFKGEFSLDGF